MIILRSFWNSWKKFGKFVGDIIGRLFLTIFYFTIFAPFGLGVRLFGDPLAIKKNHPVRWIKRTTRDLSLIDGRRLS
jgi:hypothetical protein